MEKYLKLFSCLASNFQFSEISFNAFIGNLFKSTKIANYILYTILRDKNFVLIDKATNLVHGIVNQIVKYGRIFYDKLDEDG